MYVYTCIYIERDIERDMYIYIYTYIYIHTYTCVSCELSCDAWDRQHEVLEETQYDIT